MNQLTAVLISSLVFVTMPTTGHAAGKADAIRQFQKTLIEDEITVATS